MARSVTAISTASAPTEAFVMKFFEPFSTQSSPSRTAVVFVPLESDPASASVRPQAASHSPEASFGMYRRRCASVPNWKRWFEPRLLCAASDSAIDGSTRESSSTIAA